MSPLGVHPISQNLNNLSLARTQWTAYRHKMPRNEQRIYYAAFSSNLWSKVVDVFNLCLCFSYSNAQRIIDYIYILFCVWQNWGKFTALCRSHLDLSFFRFVTIGCCTIYWVRMNKKRATKREIGKMGLGRWMMSGTSGSVCTSHEDQLFI